MLKNARDIKNAKLETHGFQLFKHKSKANFQNYNEIMKQISDELRIILN
jgi:hypothetical protein